MRKLKSLFKKLRDFFRSFYIPLSEPVNNIEKIKQSLDEMVYSYLAPASEVLCIVYGVISLVNAFFLPPGVSVKLVWITLLSAVTFFLVRVFLQYTKVPVKSANFLFFLLSFVSLAVSLLHIYFTSAPEQAISLYLLLFGSSFIFLSPAWFSLNVFFINAGWILCILILPKTFDWVYYSLGLVFSTGLSVVIFSTKYNIMFNLENLRFQSELMNQELKKALENTVEAKRNSEVAKEQLEIAMLAVQQSEERFRRFSELTTEGIVIHSLGEIIDANSAFARIFGYETEEILKKNLIELIPTDKQAEVIAKLYSDSEEKFETQGLRKDGTIFDLAIFERIIPYKGKKVKVSAFRDITIQKENEKIIKEHAKEIEILNQITSVGNLADSIEGFLENVLYSILTLLNYDSGGVFLCNDFKKLEKIFGIQPEFFEIVKNIEFSEEKYNKFISRGIPIFMDDFSEKYPREALEFGVVSAICIPLFFKGKVYGVFNIFSKNFRKITFKDVSIFLSISRELGMAVSKMLVEEALKASEEKYRELVENAASIILRMTPKGEITFFNEFAEKFFNLKGEEIIGKNIIGTIIPEKDSRGNNLKEVVEIFLKNPQDNPFFESEVITKSGKRVWVAWTNKAILDSSGKLLEILTVGTDITSRKELEETKDEFISTVSHELRTPLAIIKESISLIVDGVVGSCNEKQNNLLKMSMENIDRLGRIIDSLLDISKIEMGKMELKKEIINLNEVVNKVVANFQAQANSKSLQIKKVFSHSDIFIKADNDKIIQVFTNLLDNAFKFTDEGFIEIGLNDKENGVVECFVADTGIGIARENLPKLFSKFEQFGRKPGGGAKGTGLGLSIVKGIIEKHKGKIWAESEPGKGTKFIFVIPKDGGD